jgi:hypothetical protein
MKGTEIMKNKFVSFKEIKERLRLPSGSEFCGYIVHLPDSDEFLALISDRPDITTRGFVKSPGYAKIYEDYRDAIRDANKCRNRVIVCLLIDNDDNFIVAPCDD